MTKDRELALQKMLKDTMIEKAPEGMVQRIMNHVKLHPVRRISVAPVKDKPIAALMPIITILILGAALIIKPQSWFNFSTDQYINLNINPIWIAPVVIFTLAFWAGILLRKYWEPYIKGSE